MVTIAVEPARQPEIVALLELSDAFALALYPADSCYMLDVGELEAPGVTVFVARSNGGTAIGMAALVERGDGTAELKRMFVSQDARGQGVASALLDGIEGEARARGIRLVQLETGPLQPEAIALYAKHGYGHIDRFGPYVDDEFSVCMEKSLDEE